MDGLDSGFLGMILSPFWVAALPPCPFVVSTAWIQLRQMEAIKPCAAGKSVRDVILIADNLKRVRHSGPARGGQEVTEFQGKARRAVGPIKNRRAAVLDQV